MSHDVRIALTIILFLSCVIGCAANAPGDPEGPVPAPEDKIQHTNGSRTSSPYATVIQLKNGGEVIAFGYYSNPERTIIVVADPGQPTRLIYPAPVPASPIIVPMWYHELKK